MTAAETTSASLSQPMQQPGLSGAAGTAGALAAFSQALADLTAQVGHSVVRVDDGSRLTATGLVWSEDGLIVTTSHGVEQDNNLFIETADGTRLPARLIAREADTDLALLRVQNEAAAPLPPLRHDLARVPRVGQLTLAVARPGAFGLSATLGLIGARLDTTGGGQDEYILHTDAPLYPGFSGGALVDMDGHLLGVTNLSFGRGKGVALGTPLVAHAVARLSDRGGPGPGYLGVSAQQVALPAAWQQSLSLAQPTGLLVVAVEPGGGAERAGLQLGDTLLALNTQLLPDVDTLRQQLRGMQAGQEVTLDLVRGGVRHTLRATLAPRG